MYIHIYISINICRYPSMDFYVWGRLGNCSVETSAVYTSATKEWYTVT